jgi:hypothetical protein
MNRRNAMLGWAVWQLAKRVAASKAKRAVPKVDSGSKRPTRSAALLVGLAAAAGAVLVWRKTHGDDAGSEGFE